MDTVNNCGEGVPISMDNAHGSSYCGSPHRSEQMCDCKFDVGHVFQDLSIGDIKAKNRSPGLQPKNKLSRRIMKQKLKELRIQSNIILSQSHIIMQKTKWLHDQCLIAWENESMSEENESMTEGNESMTQKTDSMTEENDSMTRDTSFVSRSGRTTFSVYLNSK